MLSIDLNCDMGEGYLNDALILPYISSVNIACGFHAGNEDTMKRTVAGALLHNVAIGAHPSYPDRENFGRIDILHIKLQPKDLEQVVSEQILLMQQVCHEMGADLHHVKPHGALYNRAAHDEEAANSICEAIRKTGPSLLLYGLSGSPMQLVAERYQLQFVHEVFADRTYQPDGSLTPRTAENALIENTHRSLQQVLTMVREGRVVATNGQSIPLKAETICIHGDGSQAVSFAKAIYTSLREYEITLKPPAKNEQR